MNQKVLGEMQCRSLHPDYKLSIELVLGRHTHGEIASVYI